MRSQRQIRIFLSCSIGLYLAVRLGLAAYGELALRLQDPRSNNRLANVRQLPREAVPKAIDLYLSKIPGSARNVIFLGDSQIYGYGRPPQQTCPALLQDDPAVRHAGMTVHNLGVIAGRPRDGIRILEALNDARTSVETIVLSANPAHFRETTPPPEKDRLIPRLLHKPSIFRALLLTHDNIFDLTGASWQTFRKLYPIDLFDDLSVPREDYAFSDPGPQYCADLDPALGLPDLLALMVASKKMGTRVIFYTQPRYYRDHLAPPYNYDWPTQEVDQAVLAAARENQCDSILDLADAFPRDHFSDLAHLNQKGHVALKNILLPHLLSIPSSRAP